MGTEVRIGIATGLLIVGVAGVYFFYGSNRDAADLKIVTSGSPVAPPQIPPGRNTTPSSGVTAKPSGVSPSRTGISSQTPTATTPRTVHAASPRESALSTNRPTAPTSSLASDTAMSDRSITRPVGSSTAATPASPSQAGAAGTSWVTPITASTGSHISTNRPVDPPTTGLASSNDRRTMARETIADSTPLRTSPSSSLREATQRNLEITGESAPISSKMPVASADPTDSSRQATKTPGTVDPSASLVNRRTEPNSIVLPPSLQPTGPKPASNQDSRPTMVASAQSPAERSATIPTVSSGANAPRSGSVTTPGTMKPDNALPTNYGGSGSAMKPAANHTTTPSAPAVPPSHVIAAGDTFSTISSKYYGSTKEVARIVAANPKLDPRRLKIGDTVVLPAQTETSSLATTPTADPRTPARTAALTTGSTGSANGATVVQPAVATTGVSLTGAVIRPESVATSRSYTVREGDTLYGIAEKAMGKGARWKELLDKNRATLKNDPKRLKPGMVLTIP